MIIPLLYTQSADFYLFLGIIELVWFIATLVLRKGMLSFARLERDMFLLPSRMLLLTCVCLPFLTFFTLGIALSPNAVPLKRLLLPEPLGLFIVGSFFASIPLVVGILGGASLGLWRLGSKYKSRLIRIAAVFYIIPGINIISALLTLLGVKNISERTSHRCLDTERS
jgi:hypothetical protein